MTAQWMVHFLNSDINNINIHIMSTELVVLVLMILLHFAYTHGQTKAINGKSPQAAATLIKKQNVSNVAIRQS